MFINSTTYFHKQFTVNDAKQLLIKLDSSDENSCNSIKNDIAMHLQQRIEENYFSPIELLCEQTDQDCNVGFITMGLLCVLIELLYEIKNGIDECSGCNAYKAILPTVNALFNRQLAYIFYKGIRCGIIHQGQTKENTAISFETNKVIVQSDQLYLFNPRILYDDLAIAYANYWKDVTGDDYANNDLSYRMVSKYRHVLNNISI